MSATRGPRFALPGSWGRINLATEATTLNSIRKVVEHSVGRDDKLASLRADLRKKFKDAASIARESSAIDFHIALELAPGVPLPAWLAVFLPEIEAEDFERLGLSELSAFLDAGLTIEAAKDPAVSTTLDVEQVHAVRQAFHRVKAATEDEPALELLQVDYWLAAANPNRLALMTFTTNFVEFEEQMLDLFDAVISTVRWPSPAAATPSTKVKA